MAKKRGTKAKDPAKKNTLNPPTGGPGPHTTTPQTMERQPGQYTGEGVPALMKK